MRAWELSQFGLENLALVDRPEPVVGPGQVKIRVRAASLNSRDLQVIHDKYDPNQRLPIVPVSDGVGEVVEVGQGVTRVAVGDRVVPVFAQHWVAGEKTWARWLSHVGGHYDGMLQEVAVLEAEGVCRVPEHLTDVQAAAACVAAATAWEALFTLGDLRPGQTVLVQGTGGVSLFALQFAVMAGARVIATSSSDEKLARATELGAWQTVNYRSSPSWDEQVLELTGGAGVDHVIENAGDLERSVNCVAIGGLVSLIGYMSQLALDDPSSPAYTYRVGVIPMLLKNVRIHGISAAPRESYEAMYRAIAAAGLRPVVDSVFPFEEAPAALDLMMRGSYFGKIAITV